MASVDQGDARLKGARYAGGRVLLLTAPWRARRRALIREFTAGFPAAEHVAYDAISHDAIARANEATYGERVLPRYRLDRADVLVTLGADPLGSFLSTVEQGRDFAKRRRPELGSMSRVIAIEPILTLTGTNADRRVRVRPDHLYPVALALADAGVCSRVGGPATNGSRPGEPSTAAPAEGIERGRPSPGRRLSPRAARRGSKPVLPTERAPAGTRSRSNRGELITAPERRRTVYVSGAAANRIVSDEKCPAHLADSAGEIQRSWFTAPPRLLAPAGSDSPILKPCPSS